MSKVNVLLVGPVGTGKTTALRSAVRAGHPLFVISTEPGIESILGPGSKEGDLHGQAHWHYIPPAAEDWSTLIKNAEALNRFSIEDLVRQKPSNKQDYRQFLAMLETCNEFRCDVCRESFGNVRSFPTTSLLALDGLSGLSKMSMDLVVGGKPIASQPEWGAAMGNLEKFLSTLCSDTRCNFCLISHIEREQDEISGGTKLTVSTLGRKLAPKIPRFFDEVVLCRREGSKFFWSNTDNGTDLKSRRLPFGDSLSPDFAPLLEE